jgi:hypothetical protein
MQKCREDLAREGERLNLRCTVRYCTDVLYSPTHGSVVMEALRCNLALYYSSSQDGKKQRGRWLHCPSEGTATGQ